MKRDGGGGCLLVDVCSNSEFMVPIHVKLERVLMTFEIKKATEIYEAFVCFMIKRDDLCDLEDWELPFLTFIRTYAPDTELYFYRLWVTKVTGSLRRAIGTNLD